MKISYSLFIAIICCWMTIQASSVNDSGHIATSRTWDTDTVYVIGEVIVDSGCCLTIAPGTYVEFQSHFDIYVKGQLSAQGTMNDSIVFAAKDAKVGWGGIRFEETPEANDSSRLIFCRITNGRADRSKGGAVFIFHFSKVRISNCTIAKCTATQGGGIYCGRYASPVLTNNLITNDTASNCGGGISCESSSAPLIMNNVIRGNRSEYGGGIYYESAYPTITNNRILNNSASQYGGGIFCASSNATLSGNIISSNQSQNGGGGIYCFGSSPWIINCTIVNNQAVQGGGMVCEGYLPAQPKVMNSIVWGNFADSLGKQVCLASTNGDPNFLYCDIQGGITDFAGDGSGSGYTGTYQNNLDVDPKLKTSTMELGSTSPCINAGTPDTSGVKLPTADFAGNPRVHQNRVDIGAYEYQGNVPVTSSTSPPPPSRFQLSLFTSAGGPVMHFTVPASAARFDLVITDVHGRMIKKLAWGACKGGCSVQWDATNLSGFRVPAGVYFCRVTVDHAITAIGRILLTR
jgi:parallel beta-helix repeat protein